MNRETEIPLFVFTNYNEEDGKQCTDAISNGSFFVKTNIGNELEHELRIKFVSQDVKPKENYDSIRNQIRNNKYEVANPSTGKFTAFLFADGYFGTFCNRKINKTNNIETAIAANGAFNSQDLPLRSVFNLIILENGKIVADIISFADIDPLAKESRVYQMKELKKKLYEMSAIK